MITQRRKKIMALPFLRNPRYVSAFILGWMTLLLLWMMGWYEYRIATLTKELTQETAMNHRPPAPARDLPTDRPPQPQPRTIPFPEIFDDFFGEESFSLPLPWTSESTQTFHQTRITPEGTLSSTITYKPPHVQGSITAPTPSSAASLTQKLRDLGLTTKQDGTRISFSGTINDISELMKLF